MSLEIGTRRALAAAWILVLGACDAPAPERITYEKDVRQLVQKRCAGCHGPASPTMAEFDKDKARYKGQDLGPRYDSYENLMVVVNGTDTGALMRRLDDGKNTRDGKPGNMHKHLGDDDAQRAASLTLLKRWVGGWTLKRTAEISAEERAAILAPRD